MVSLSRDRSRWRLGRHVMLSEHRDLAAAKAFFRSAKTVTGVTPDRVTTDGHDAYPRAIRTELGRQVQHRMSCYLNNRLERDHRGIKGRCRPMLGLKSTASAARYCQCHDELRNFLRCRSRIALVREWTGDSSLHLGSTSHRLRTVTGIPKPVIRLSALHPILVSVH